ncbi:MAG: hypothetical protein LBP61_04770, partial [Desulfovibrio sp.]|nr:hypothetical protein [Desulfovibrio sp.]
MRVILRARAASAARSSAFLLKRGAVFLFLCLCLLPAACAGLSSGRYPADAPDYRLCADLV